VLLLVLIIETSACVHFGIIGVYGVSKTYRNRLYNHLTRVVFSSGGSHHFLSSPEGVLLDTTQSLFDTPPFKFQIFGLSSSFT
jgi:hypothetical protein